MRIPQQSCLTVATFELTASIAAYYMAYGNISYLVNKATSVLSIGIIAIDNVSSLLLTKYCS